MSLTVFSSSVLNMNDVFFKKCPPFSKNKAHAIGGTIACAILASMCFKVGQVSSG